VRKIFGNMAGLSALGFYEFYVGEAREAVLEIETQDLD